MRRAREPLQHALERADHVLKADDVMADEPPLVGEANPAHGLAESEDVGQIGDLPGPDTAERSRLTPQIGLVVVPREMVRVQPQLRPCFRR